MIHQTNYHPPHHKAGTGACTIPLVEHVVLFPIFYIGGWQRRFPPAVVEGNQDFYVGMAKAFLSGKDAYPNKLLRYYENIAK